MANTVRARRRAAEPPGHHRSARDATTRRRAPTTGRSGCAASLAGARRWTRPTPGSVGRNMEMYYNLNAVPDGAASSTCIRRTATRRQHQPTAALPADFLRPYRGYGASACAAIRRRPTTTRSRCRSIAATSTASSSARAYTLQRARGHCGRGSRQPVDFAQPSRDWFYGELAQSNRRARRQLLVGSCRAAGAASSISWRSAPARRLAALGRERLRQRRLGRRHPDHDGQLRLHRRRRWATAAASRGSDPCAHVGAARSSSAIPWPAAGIR